MDHPIHMYEPLFTSCPTLQAGQNKFTRLPEEKHTQVWRELQPKCHSLEVLSQAPGIVQTPYRGIGDLAISPWYDAQAKKRKVVVIDCAWAKAQDGQLEPVALCAIDFLTGTTLINSFIKPAPHHPIVDWRSNVHGITETVVEIEPEKNRFHGWEEARAEVFKFIDQNTILVGHSMITVPSLLRILHGTVVDSQVLTIAAVFKGNKMRLRHRCPLEKICENFLGLRIHTLAYDARERALASREVVLHTIFRPDDFDVWGNGARRLFRRGPKRKGKWRPGGQESKL